MEFGEDPQTRGPREERRVRAQRLDEEVEAHGVVCMPGLSVLLNGSCMWYCE